METTRLENFTGINNRASDNKMPAGALRECVNFDLDVNGLLHQRNGYFGKIEGVFTRVWSDNKRCFGVMDGDLVEITEVDDTYSAAVLQSSVDDWIDFSECDGDYYFVGATVTGKITGSSVVSFGIDKVNAVPTLSAVSGTMAAGRYQVAVTHIDANGFESGVGSYALITLTANSSISLNNIPTSINPRVLYAIIYVSTPNGKEVYRNGIVANGVTTYSITDIAADISQLFTKSLDSAPNGTIIRYHYGRLFIANANYVFYSQGQDYEHFDARNYLAYSEAVTAVLPCEDGLWISADGLYFIQGRNPDVFTLQESQVKKADLRIYQNSCAFVEARNLKIDGYSGYGWYATTDDGIVFLGNGGFMRNETNATYLMPSFTEVCGALIETPDSYHYAAIMIDGILT